MWRSFWHLFTASILFSIHYARAERDVLPEIPRQEPHQHGPPSLPFIDEPPHKISLWIPRPSLVSEPPFQDSGSDESDDASSVTKLAEEKKPIESIDAPNILENKQTLIGDDINDREKRQSWASFIPFLNPSDANNQVHFGLFGTLSDRIKNDLAIIKQRQDVILRYSDLACQNSPNCPPVENINLDDFIGNSRQARLFWNRGKSDNPLGLQRLYEIFNAFKNAVERLTIRQNALYEHVSCSCNAQNECSATVKPILEVLFSNSAYISGELVNSLHNLSQHSSNKIKNFIHYLIQFIADTPKIAGWLGTSLNYFNPLSTIFGGGLFSELFLPTDPNRPPGGFWTDLLGINRPGFSSSQSPYKPGISVSVGGPLGGGVGVGGGFGSGSSPGFGIGGGLGLGGSGLPFGAGFGFGGGVGSGSGGGGWGQGGSIFGNKPSGGGVATSSSGSGYTGGTSYTSTSGGVGGSIGASGGGGTSYISTTGGGGGGSGSSYTSTSGGGTSYTSSTGGTSSGVGSGTSYSSGGGSAFSKPGGGVSFGTGLTGGSVSSTFGSNQGGGYTHTSTSGGNPSGGWSFNVGGQNGAGVSVSKPGGSSWSYNLGGNKPSHSGGYTSTTGGGGSGGGGGWSYNTGGGAAGSGLSSGTSYTSGSSGNGITYTSSSGPSGGVSGGSSYTSTSGSGNGVTYTSTSGSGSGGGTTYTTTSGSGPHGGGSWTYNVGGGSGGGNIVTSSGHSPSSSSVYTSSTDSVVSGSEIVPSAATTEGETTVNLTESVLQGTPEVSSSAEAAASSESHREISHPGFGEAPQIDHRITDTLVTPNNVRQRFTRQVNPVAAAGQAVAYNAALAAQHTVAASQAAPYNPGLAVSHANLAAQHTAAAGQAVPYYALAAAQQSLG